MEVERISSTSVRYSVPFDGTGDEVLPSLGELPDRAPDIDLSGWVISGKLSRGMALQALTP